MMIHDLGRLKIGLFALLTPETAQTSSPQGAVTFLPILAAVRGAVSRLKAKGADLIAAITHLSIQQDRQLAWEVRDIGVILGGHEHIRMAVLERGTLILKAGSDTHFLAVANLRVEKKTPDGKAEITNRPRGRFISTAGVVPDEAMAKAVAGYQIALDKSLGQILGRTKVELDSRFLTVRRREAAMGNLIADAMRDAVGADMALTNGGGIRGNRTYEAGSALSRGDVLGEIPFGNVTVKLAISGAQLRAALEHGVSRVSQFHGGFPQVSELRFTHDPARPVGGPVLAVMIGGKPLEPAKIYSLETNNYLAGGGDGYGQLKATKRLVDASAAKLMATQVMDYIIRRATIAPKVEERVLIK